MSDLTAGRLVTQFLDAVASRDFDRARECLAAEDFYYVGPLNNFRDRDALVEDMKRVDPILKKVQHRRIFEDGDEACAVFNFISTLEQLAVTRIAMWVHCRAGVIHRMELFYDSHAYQQMFAPATESTD